MMSSVTLPLVKLKNPRPQDQSRIRKENAPQCMAIIRHIALNLLQSQKNSMKRQSIKRLRKMAGWSDDVLSAIISHSFS
jgi:hypothetical protein